MENEIWKDIPNYEGFYQVSNLGRVKSLKRTILGKKRKTYVEEKYIKQMSSPNKYLKVNLRKNGLKQFAVHQLVAMAFLNHTPNGNTLVVDHINDNKIDNRLENIQVVTSRYNSCKTQGRYSSKYKGVTWRKLSKRWIAQIRNNGKNIHLGIFKDEFEAHLAYEKALEEITK